MARLPPVAYVAFLLALGTLVARASDYMDPPSTLRRAIGPLNSSLHDTFRDYNTSLWEYADGSMGKTDGSKVWYLKNHSRVGSTLSLNAGTGLQMIMSSEPCKIEPSLCGGAKMAADHLETTTTNLQGDYELRMRAPYTAGKLPVQCSDGVYAYFTAGFMKKSGVWNEMNFGFHPDRDSNGTAVSCEHHDDTGKYHETNIRLGFNYRASFNTFVIRLGDGTLTWLVGHGSEPLKAIHSVEANITLPMTTRLIFRTNFRAGDPGFMDKHIWEIAEFNFKPKLASHF